MYWPVYFPEESQRWIRIAHWKIKRPDGSYFKASFNSEEEAEELCLVLNDSLEEELE